ncbi:hypothetical protein DSM104299_05526 [Baekduia alba]|uniref:EAL domain-containing protein n=1 Tax=Baekduia alba TaxID=2997333 RepID=UPI002340A6B0|nr:EAL domain-containing protein [Baekduia alba]WCB96758.1 hypothetical protein DSM104299_05526 [Baekduia alba]
MREERDRAQRTSRSRRRSSSSSSPAGASSSSTARAALLGFAEDARRGRDWFNAVVPATDRLDARRAEAQVADHDALTGLPNRPQLGASIGVALFPEHATDAESLLKRSDSAMSQAKRTGSGSVALYEQQEGDARARLSLTTRLRRAIGEVRLHCQPIVSPTDGLMIGVEALVRWEDPTHGLVPPADVIPIAEETGLIDPIGDCSSRSSVSRRRAGPRARLRRSWRGDKVEGQARAVPLGAPSSR